MVCDRCIPDDAETAWRTRGDLTATATVCREPHFAVALVACSACGQSFASVFSERIDWRDGNDPQSTLLIPVSAVEARAVESAGDDVERVLHRLGARRHLDAYFGAGPKHDVTWSEATPRFMPHH